jgi:two-component system, LytTR family, response regulator
LPLVAFVTAFDEYAVRAFELHAVDYLLKPVDKARLRETLNRAHERLDRSEQLEVEAARVRNAAAAYEASARPLYLERLPVRHADEILILPVREIVSVVAEGELLRVTNVRNEQYSFSYRLKDLEARLDPASFVRLGRGILANVEKIVRVSPMPGGTYRVTLSNNQQLSVSRQQSRVLRDQLLKI